MPIDEQASINTPEAGHSTVPANNIAHTSNESQESSNTDRRPFNIKESGKVTKNVFENDDSVRYNRRKYTKPMFPGGVFPILIEAFADMPFGYQVVDFVPKSIMEGR